jgi:hypothetical protein
MNTLNQKQHFVSQVLLRRFTISGHLQCYDVESDTWKSKGTRNVFSARGWNQLLVAGHSDNTLEAQFSLVESRLPKTLEALEGAVTKSSTTLPSAIYQNMCQYCTFLWLTSPFAKAKAVIDLVMQLDLDLKSGKDTLLRDLGCTDETIKKCQQAHALGGKIIIDSTNNLQLVYRFQFRRSYEGHYNLFSNSVKWTICNSPIELPVSDIALVQLDQRDMKATFYILPISPKRLLKGRIDHGPQGTSSQPNIKGDMLTAAEAEYWFDAICLSAVTELISTRMIPDMVAARSRAKTKGIAFQRIVNPDRLISAGITEPSHAIGLRVVSTPEWVKFVHSFILPSTHPPSLVGAAAY